MTAMVKKSMRLFGMPYQFTDSVDPRVKSLSTTVGRQFIDHIVLEAPVVTLIPGKPYYLPSDNEDSRKSTTSALLEASALGNNSALKAIINDKTNDDFRLYDFQRSYIEYMKYVNVLCRAGASFLELSSFSIDSTPLTSYDWKNYRQTSSSYQDATGSLTSYVGKKAYTALTALTAKASDIFTKTKKKDTSVDTDVEEDASLEDMLTNYNYVQFYVDPDVSCSESLSNSTSESQLKSAFDSGSSMLKEFAFMANSGGVDATAIEDFASNTASSLSSGVTAALGTSSSAVGQASSALSRVINLGSNVVKGENVIMPDIYQSTSYSKSYSMTVHLKSPYGTKLGYYMEVFVPMMHLMAFAIPKQTSANTYGSPFLVKAYCEGVFTCNMGIVSSISINRVADSWSVDGLPTEVDVTLNIDDLYSDLTMTPQSSPAMFVQNSSLVEYLATMCGLSLVTPTLGKKLDLAIDTTVQSFKDIPNSVVSSARENIDNVISGFTGLTW